MRPLQASVLESLEKATSLFHDALRQGGGGPAVEYLARRGIDPASPEGGAVVDKFRLGYVATDDVPGFERFAGRLAIPNICASGHVVHMKFRALDPDDDRKYDAVSLPQRLFNLRALNEAGPVLWLTEGELDAITLELLGVPAVAIPGSNNWQPHHARVLEGFERLVLIQDDDDAGENLADRLRSTELPLLVAKPPAPHKDINAAFAAGDVERLRELIERTGK